MPNTAPPPPGTSVLCHITRQKLANGCQRERTVTTMAGQHGMAILCDAAGSDLLPSPSQSLLSSSATGQPQQKQQQPGRRAKRPRSSAPEDAVTTSPASPSSPHTCHVCKRVYDRADHLTRHLRSHENARPYQCTRCPKRFNRA